MRQNKKANCSANHSCWPGTRTNKNVIESPSQSAIECKSISGNTRLRSVSAFAFVAIVLSGCTVSPNPMSRAEMRAQIATDAVKLPGGNQELEGVVDIERALVHAVVHNHGLRAKAFQSALAKGEVSTAALGMLPDLVTEAGYQERDKYDASASVILIDGEPDTLPSEPEYSVSSGLRTRTEDMRFTWNLLDFGLSYVRAKQFADRQLIEQERERKALQTITAQVRAAYWKAVSAERLLPQIDPLIADANAALKEARSLEKEGLLAPRAALEDQRRMLDILRLLQDLKAGLASAKVELAELMGLHPSAEFELADARSPALNVPHLHTAVQALEQAALENRPEMREAYYQTRVSASEARAAMLKLLPGIQLTATDSYEDNEYLRSQNWNTLGAAINFNLFNIFAVVPTQDLAAARKRLAETQRLATAMTIIAQVHIAAVEFAEAKESYSLSEEYLDVARRIVGQADAQVDTESSGTQDLIRETLNGLLAEIRRDRAYAQVQNSFGRVLDSAGIDIFPSDYRALDADALASVVEKRIEQIKSGDLPLTGPRTQQEKNVASELAGVVESAAQTGGSKQEALEQAVVEKAAVSADLEHKKTDTKTSIGENSAETGAAKDECERRFLGMCVDNSDDAVEPANADVAASAAEPEIKVEALPDAPKPVPQDKGNDKSLKAEGPDCDRNVLGFCKAERAEGFEDEKAQSDNSEPDPAIDAQNETDQVEEAPDTGTAEQTEATPAQASNDNAAPLSAIDWLIEDQE